MNQTDTTHPSRTDNEDTFIFKRSHVYAMFIPVAFVLGLAAGYFLWGNSSHPSQPPVALAEQVTQAAQVPQPPQDNNPASPDAAGRENNPAPNNPNPAGTPRVHRYDVPVDDDPVLGSADAPITIIEFSDYECPYCKRFHNEVLPRLIKEYGDKIRFVYRDFPLSSMHSNSESAAEAANCAGEQNAYWQFSDKLFGGEFPLGKNAYLKYAEQLNLDMTTFGECLSSKRQHAEVMADLSYATQLGIRSTPTFFLNGIPIVGAQPYEVFKQVIDKELAGEIP